MRDIMDRCRVWDHSDQNRRLLTVTNDSRKFPTVPDNFRGPSAVIKDFPAISEGPGIEPLVSIAMVRPVPLEELTILEVLAQTYDIGPYCELWGEVAESYRNSVTVPINPSMGSGSATSGKPPDIEGALRQLISKVMGPDQPLDGPASDPGRQSGTAGESFCVERGGIRDGVFFVCPVKSWR